MSTLKIKYEISWTKIAPVAPQSLSSLLTTSECYQQSGRIMAIISDSPECEVGRKLEEKFEAFLEEGLLDPLLQYIVKDSEKDIDFKVGEIIKIQPW